MSGSVPESMIFRLLKNAKTVIKKPTPIELELKYIEKSLVSQSRKEYFKSLIFLPQLSNLHYEFLN
jgi:hypothetical protein